MKIKLFTIFLISLFINVSFAASITSWKNAYDENADIWLQLHDKPDNEKDWIGIYPKDANNNWANVISWVWANDTSVTQYSQGDWYKFEDPDSNHFGENGYEKYAIQPPVGEYEARFFLNNGFQLEAKTLVFQVGDVTETETQLTLDKQSYATTDSIQISYSNMSGNPQDWFGIYKQGDSNDWANVKNWEWSGGFINNSVTIDYQDLPAGNYEVRAFFNNTFNLEKAIAFTVKEYWEKGTEEVAHEKVGDAIVYYPKNLNGNTANVVFLAQGGHSDPEDRHPTLLNFIASQGYYVIGVKLSGEGESRDFLFPRTRITQKYVDVVTALRADGKNINTDKIGVIGTSSGGGNTFSILHELKDTHSYGANGSFILAMESWYAFEMNEAELESLSADGKTNTVILEFGNKGNIVQADPVNGTNYTTDALFPLTNFFHISKNHPENSSYHVYERSRYDEPYTAHLYSQDRAVIGGIRGENYQQMQGLLTPLGALMSLTFDDGNNGDARNVALNSGSDTPVATGLHLVKEKTEDYEYQCLDGYSKYSRIDYCKFDAVRDNIPNL